jgi:hypothetical protein
MVVEIQRVREWGKVCSFLALCQSTIHTNYTLKKITCYVIIHYFFYKKITKSGQRARVVVDVAAVWVAAVAIYRSYPPQATWPT